MKNKSVGSLPGPLRGAFMVRTDPKTRSGEALKSEAAMKMNYRERIVRDLHIVGGEAVLKVRE